MRRSDREIVGQDKLLAVIRQCDVCRLAFNDPEGWPYILPLNFGVEEVDGQLLFYFHGASVGKKYELLARDDRVSFELDCCHELFTEPEKQNCSMAYQSVMGRGRLSIVPEDEKLHALTVLMGHYHQEEFPINRAAMARTTVMKLTVESMTGKQRRRH